MPQRDGDARGYGGRDRRLRPLRRKVRRMREDVTDERRDRADRRLPADAVDRPVHLHEQGDGHRRADNAADRGETGVLETERGENVAARHHQKAGEPGPRELLCSGAGKAARAKLVERIEHAEFEAWHRLALFPAATSPRCHTPPERVVNYGAM